MESVVEKFVLVGFVINLTHIIAIINQNLYMLSKIYMCFSILCFKAVSCISFCLLTRRSTKLSFHDNDLVLSMIIKQSLVFR